MKTFLIATLVLMLGAPLVWAEVLDLSACTCTIPDGAAGAAVFVRPDGAGLPFTNAFAPGGAVVDATVTVTLMTNFGNPVVGFPGEDLWLLTTEGGLVHCDGAVFGAGLTDANGQMMWFAPLAAGGNSEGEQLVAYVAGDAITGSAPLALLFNSPDITGDLVVNLSDVSLFTQALGSYNWAADFNNDSVVNLSDVSRFTQGLGVFCD